MPAFDEEFDDLAEIGTRPVTHLVDGAAQLTPRVELLPASGTPRAICSCSSPTADLCFAGDLCFFGVTPLAFQGDPATWADMLDVVVELADVIVPGHGPVGGEAEVRDLQGYLRACVDARGDVGAIAAGPWDALDRPRARRHQRRARRAARAGRRHAPAVDAQGHRSGLTSTAARWHRGDGSRRNLPPWRRTPIRTSSSRAPRVCTRTLDDWSTMFHLCLVILPPRPEASALHPDRRADLQGVRRRRLPHRALRRRQRVHRRERARRSGVRSTSASSTPTPSWSRASASPTCRPSCTCARTPRWWPRPRAGTRPRGRRWPRRSASRWPGACPPWPRPAIRRPPPAGRSEPVCEPKFNAASTRAANGPDAGEGQYGFARVPRVRTGGPPLYGRVVVGCLCLLCTTTCSARTETAWPEESPHEPPSSQARHHSPCSSRRSG